MITCRIQSNIPLDNLQDSVQYSFRQSAVYSPLFHQVCTDQFNIPSHIYRIHLNIPQAKPSQGKVLTGDVDLCEAQVNVPLSVSHSRV
jgi:hypothetical protein